MGYTFNLRGGALFNAQTADAVLMAPAFGKAVLTVVWRISNLACVFSIDDQAIWTLMQYKCKKQI